MNLLARLLRSGAKLRFKALRLATIKHIPTGKFNTLLESLIRSGWKRTYIYDGMDAWIDYGQVKLKKDGVRLNCEWDNWNEGSIEGPASDIQEIGERYGLRVSGEWRWSESDPKP
ncbi:hypothetical protein [Microbulbifer yueqingensis]|uniref:Uncharacterized protein n=1 Tax=Microbulbifer yueqingensis TaxID=658219 RepID=A0A1G9ELT6_9GAMM|nr:hypothetical protein [Microbulbifer yueqingensis]SDK77157.1 hypothetical protein SAMN05216212_3190 [Microbulbifer yueqingensis]